MPYSEVNARAGDFSLDVRPRFGGAVVHGWSRGADSAGSAASANSKRNGELLHRWGGEPAPRQLRAGLCRLRRTRSHVSLRGRANPCAAATGRPAPGRKPARNAARPSTVAASRSSPRCVRGHHGQAHAGGAFRHGRRADGFGEDAQLERVVDDPRGELGVADDERDDVGGGAARPRSPRGRGRRAAPRRWRAASSTRRGCSSSRSSAAIAAAAATGGSAVECSSVRAECTRKRAVTWSQATKPP